MDLDHFGSFDLYLGNFEPVYGCGPGIWACYVGSGPIWACLERSGPRFWRSGHGFEPFGAYFGGSSQGGLGLDLGRFGGLGMDLGHFGPTMGGLGVDFGREGLGLDLGHLWSISGVWNWI